MEYDSVTKGNELLPPETTWMDLESIVLSEVGHTERHKCRMILLICAIWKKTKINKQAEQKQIDRYREQFHTCPMGGEMKGLVKKLKGLRNTDW